MPNVRLAILRAIALSACVGCAGPSEPDTSSPLGTDTELYGEWDVNGQVPSAEVCAIAGLTTIELAFFRLEDATTEYTSETLRFPCADGYFDSGTERLLRAGRWEAEWRAYAGSELVRRSMRYPIDAVRGQEVTVHAVDFADVFAPVDLDIALRWATGTAFGTCDEAFTDTMSWELRVGSGTGAVEASSVGSATCANAIVLHGYPHGALSVGLHMLVIHGDATDGAAWSAECGVTVPEGGPASAMCDVPRVP